MKRSEREMETGIQNPSEIGRLKKVLLHRPGQELENLMPDYLERLFRISGRPSGSTMPLRNASGNKG